MGNGLHQRLSQSERKLSPWEADGSRLEYAGPFYFDLEIICSTTFDSWLRSWEWHKGKKHRHPHLNHLRLLPTPYRRLLTRKGRLRSTRRPPLPACVTESRDCGVASSESQATRLPLQSAPRLGESVCSL